MNIFSNISKVILKDNAADDFKINFI